MNSGHYLRSSIGPYNIRFRLYGGLEVDFLDWTHDRWSIPDLSLVLT